MRTNTLRWVMPLAIGLASATAASADAVEDFYKGKNLQLLIHTSPGGGYDQYGRLMGKYIVNHIPGRPNLVVQHMPGGGGLRAVNYFSNVAPKDGTVISIISQGLPMFQAMGEEGEGGMKLESDLTKFNWMGNLSNSNQLLVTWETSPVKTLADAKVQTAVIGATGNGSISVQLPTLLNTLIGTKFKIVLGYPGGAEINLAMERGEVDGRGANPWASYKSTKSDWVAQKKINYIVQIGLERDPELPNVPLLTELPSNALDRGAAEVISNIAAFGRSVATTPGVPQDRVKALRAAMDATMKDPGFLGEAEKQKMEIGYMTGEAVDKLVKSIVQAPKPVLVRLAEAMETPKDAKDISKK